MKWTAFAAASPKLATLGEERMEEHGLILLGSLRRDGSPRITPVEPLLVDGELELGMMWQSKKALDLLRDPRCQVHTVVTDRNGTEGEFLRASGKAEGPGRSLATSPVAKSPESKLWGRARDLDLAARTRYAVALEKKIGWRPKEPFHAFAIDIESAAYRRFSPDGKIYALVWKAGGETVESEHQHEA